MIIENQTNYGLDEFKLSALVILLIHIIDKQHDNVDKYILDYESYLNKVFKVIHSLISYIS